MRMKKVRITLLADVDEKDLEEVKCLPHLTEGIFFEYPYIQDMAMNVEVLSEHDGIAGHDPYKVKQLETMLAHETASGEEHYGAKLSHWYGDTKTLTIDAGGLRALKEYYKTHRTEL